MPIADTDVKVCLDVPSDGHLRASTGNIIAGWVSIVGIGRDIESVELVLPDGTARAAESVDRPDVDLAHPGGSSAGFSIRLQGSDLAIAGFCELRCTIDGAFVAHLAQVVIEDESPWRQFKLAKLDSIRSILACPLCKRRLEDGSAGLRCEACSRVFERTSNSFNFMPADIAQSANIHPTDNVSSMGYDAVAQDLIAQFPDGLVLDCGAGCRSDRYRNVVNFEVVDYPSTDVLGVGQMLPFADGSFDVVFSFAVLEHVRDPFLCAKELVRVLKPGGRLFGAVPFLQPYHGYPDHYYNMTTSGLANLFADSMTIDEVGQPQSALPIYALSWILSEYAAGLPPDVAERFMNMRVGDLRVDRPGVVDADYVRMLSPQACEVLACGNYILATKPA
jgi:SAM-dependent methyltransferase